LLVREGVSENHVRGIRKQLTKKFRQRREVVEDNLRVRRSLDEVHAVRQRLVTSSRAGRSGAIRRCSIRRMRSRARAAGRFWEQVCSLCKIGQDGIPIRSPRSARFPPPQAQCAT
jgi:hypothetical protein